MIAVASGAGPGARATSRGAAALGALCGLVSAGVALGFAQLAAAFIRQEAAPVVAVGSVMVNSTPRWLKEWAIREFGTNDKTALLTGVLIVLAVLAAVAGAFAVRRPAIGFAMVALLGVLGAAAAVTRAGAGSADWLPSLLGAVAGALTLAALLRPLLGGRDGHGGTEGVAVPSWASTAHGQPGASRTAATPGTGRATNAGTGRATTAGTGQASGASGPDRRGVLVTAAWAVVIGGGAGWIGKMIGTRRSVAASRAAVRLPAPSSPARPLAAGTDLRLSGLSPFRTPNGSFYRIDISLVTPQVSAEGWSLKVHGMVERELTLTYKELLRRELIERDVTLACVSNEVGGNLISSARWLGAPLAELLREAGVRPGADQIISRGHDGITIGTPTQVVMDGRDAMLAVGMNGEPLPQAHGFPVRMVVPGLYGYVSATKWLSDIELGRFGDYDAYWVQRGWAQQAEIKTESRIDTPRNFAQVRAGKVPVAGIAWAQHRGIAKVEVRVDDGPWQQARLAPAPTIDTWRQWVLMWDAAKGEHRLAVRATDRDGNTQTEQKAPPFPSGATGWYSTSVRVV
ncbi:MAG: hypothetical protein QOJ60_2979 [Actinomycetota bacterium]|nr:hypothetical protein [Actinomycetota bacterium]